ncbi:bifunctional diaminohydroxyphosphoribosylaminopyrimidine deaminase/5-amino-6-(5-phosphoribosylamino)uracil reductase RibD [Paracoccus pacificus]|uniref:Riboflavin biosynthesis protein RibD n=1 Tax=Paracoccus pacificus TaxID=1463598 RepID=A0ABW4R447_9RHOB
MSHADDARHMAHALGLARRGLGNVWPNPAVGCVIVRDGIVVARGWTQPGGRPHAERFALDAAGDKARGATAYVTLEPCSHYGKTPPCADALIAAGVARVVVALTDPDPRVAGRGLARLRAAGVTVTEGVGRDQAAALNRGFLNRITLGRPMLTLKLATSLDGRIATASGESRWITGAEARRQVHLLRLTHDAVMVGGGTARADLPALNVRGFGPVRQPVRVIASARGDIPPLPEDHDAGPLWLLHDRDVAVALPPGARGIGVDSVQGHLDPVAMMRALAGAGLTRVLCEGGGALAASLLAAGLVDDLITYSAGLVLGAEGRAAVAALPLAPLSAMPRLRLRGVRRLGGDVMQLWSVVNE